MFLIFAYRSQHSLTNVGVSVEVSPYECMYVKETEEEVLKNVKIIAELDAESFLSVFSNKLGQINDLKYYTDFFICTSLVVTNEIDMNSIKNISEKYMQIYMDTFDSIVSVAHYKAKKQFLAKEASEMKRKQRDALKSLFDKYRHIGVFEKEIQDFFEET